MQRNDLGRCAEDAAAAYLKRAGLKIIKRNFRCRFGELDIIAEDKKEIVFIEVRSAGGYNFCDPLESITPVKIKRLQKLAMAWLNNNNLVDVSLRFDVVSVVCEDYCRKKFVVQHIKSAF